MARKASTIASPIGTIYSSNITPDPQTGIGWAGGYVGLGVSTSNFSGQTLADLVLDKQTERTGLPWVNRRPRKIVQVASINQEEPSPTPGTPEPFRVGVVFVVAQLIESYVLTPKLVGERIGLHPMAVIFAVMAGGQLFGFIGVLLALPVAAVLAVMLRHTLTHWFQSRLYLDPALDPAPEAVEAVAVAPREDA